MKNYEEYWNKLKAEWAESWVKSGKVCEFKQVTQAHKERVRKISYYKKACQEQAAK